MSTALPPLLPAFLAGLLSWACIALGAGGILARSHYPRRVLDILMGVAAGMMLGATFWTLLTPALELSTHEGHWGRWAFVPVGAGLALGVLFLRLFDALLPHVHPRHGITEGISTRWQRCILLVLAMALHHFPEGLAMGVSYGAVGVAGPTGQALHMDSALLLTAALLLQNLPEGFVVAATLRAEGLEARPAFVLGALTGCTTLPGSLAGALGVGVLQHLLPLALAFAGGAMLYVIVEDVLPEAQGAGHDHAASLAIIGGVLLIMMLHTLFD